MQDSDKILSRLIGILKKISNNEEAKVKELAIEFGVTQRTLQRDIYERLHHFPIEKNAQGELKFIDGFSIKKSFLEDDEMLFTYLTLSKVKESNPHFQDTIDKILKKLLKPQKEAHFSMVDINLKNIDIQILETIEDAILNNNILNIELEIESKEVKPYKIVENKTSWVLLARDCFDDKVKSINLSKVKSVEIQRKRFKTKKSLDETLSNVHSAFFTTHQAQEYVVHVNSEVADYFQNNSPLPAQEILKAYEDGSLSIGFIAESEHEVEHLIKQWLPHLTITHPESYNEVLISKMKKYIDICST